MELRSVGGRVVHREHLDAVTRGLRLGSLGVEARRCRHVEAVAGADPLVVVHQEERRGLVAWTLDARGPVRFVAEHQSEGGRAVVLRPLHEAEGLVGAEDDRHGARRRPVQRPADYGRVRRNRDLKLS